MTAAQIKQAILDNRTGWEWERFSGEGTDDPRFQAMLHRERFLVRRLTLCRS